MDWCGVHCNSGEEMFHANYSLQLAKDEPPKLLDTHYLII